MAERQQGTGTRSSPVLHYEFWLDDSHPGDVRVEHPPVSGDDGAARRVPRRRAVATAVAALVVVAAAVPLALALRSASSPTGPHVTDSPARRHVLAALDATVASGSFDISYSEQPATGTAPGNSGSGCPGFSVSPTPSSDAGTTSNTGSPLSGGGEVTPSVDGVVCSAESAGEALSGQGTIDTDPLAMVATSQVPGVGTVTTFIDGTDVWEEGGGDYGLSGGPAMSGTGSPIAGFSGLVEGTLGPRQGALSMMDLASPTGYLELDEQAVTAAARTGTSTVDGIPVTEYRVAISPADQAGPPGATPAEATAIQAALAQLATEGYTGTEVTIAIDDSGYIRQTDSVAQFSDGTTQSTEVTFSDFGCAGQVLMPGQGGSGTPPAGCVSPDTSG